MVSVELHSEHEARDMQQYELSGEGEGAKEGPKSRLDDHEQIPWFHQNFEPELRVPNHDREAESACPAPEAHEAVRQCKGVVSDSKTTQFRVGQVNSKLN